MYKMALSREETIQLEYAEMWCAAYELFDDSWHTLDACDCHRYSKLIGGWNPQQSWTEWIDARSRDPGARQRFDELVRVQEAVVATPSNYK